MITSTSNAQVRHLVALKSKAKLRRETGTFTVEGIRMFREVPAERLVSVYVTEHFLASHSEEPGAASWEVLADAVFAKVSDTVTPQGVLCVVKQAQPTLEEILDAKRPAHLLLLDGIQDPGNLGTMLRTGEGAGVTGVIASKDTVDLYNPKTIRSTMGSIYRIPYLAVEDFAATLETLRVRGVNLVAADLEGSVPYDEADYTGPTGFLIGNEGNGIRETSRALATSRIRIPMEGQVESLNAAVAAALCMYEVKRQRKG